MSRFKKLLMMGFLLSVLLLACPGVAVKAQDSPTISAQDLINLVNGIRTGSGLPALEVSSILMSTAQSTAEIMAINKMGWHIGDVRGRVMAAGYGGGATAWATENFAIGPMSLEDIAYMWSDPDHMIPMVKPAYQHIGAGVATDADGTKYYVVHAAYTSGSPLARTQIPDNQENADPTESVPQWIIPVVTATPSADGSLVHEVKMGQSLWSIAIAYNTHIVDILRVNNLSPEQQVVWIGQKLTIPYTQPPAVPQASVEPTTTSALQRLAAVSANPILPTATPARATTTGAAVVSPPPAMTSTLPATTDSGDLTILWVLGGVFSIGVVLIIYGLLAKRAATP